MNYDRSRILLTPSAEFYNPLCFVYKITEESQCHAAEGPGGRRMQRPIEPDRYIGHDGSTQPRHGELVRHGWGAYLKIFSAPSSTRTKLRFQKSDDEFVFRHNA